MVTLTREHMALVAKVRRACFAHALPQTIDDLEGEGMIGLVQASQTYRPGRGCAFTTWAWFRVRGAMIDARRRESFSSRRSPWVDQPTPVRDELLNEHLAAGPVVDRDAAIDLHAAITQLPPREAYVIKMLYFHDYTLSECARAMGVCESRISRMATRARERLAQSLAT